MYINLQLTTGETIVATCTGMNGRGYDLKYPLKILVSMTQEGETQISFIRYMPFVHIEYEIFIAKEHIITEGPLSDNMIKMYQQSILAVTKKPKKTEAKTETKSKSKTTKKDYVM